MKFIVNLLAVVCIALPAYGQVIFSDGFENGFTTGWYGRFDVFTTSTAQTHTGLSAATTNGLWHWIAVDLGSSQTSTTFECWFYDSGTNREEPLIGVSATDPCCGSQNILWVGLETFFDQANYMYGLGFTEISTTVPRSVGWHRAEFVTDGVLTSISIDGQLVATEAFQSGWRYIVIWENSKWEQPHAPTYWDDVRVYQHQPVAVQQTSWANMKVHYR